MSEPVPPETPAAGSAGAPGARGHWLGAIVVLILLQLPWPDWLFPGEGLSALGLRELVFWLMAGLLLAYVLFYGPGLLVDRLREAELEESRLGRRRRGGDGRGNGLDLPGDPPGAGPAGEGRANARGEGSAAMVPHSGW